MAQSKSWFSVKAQAESAEVFIYDEIGGWGITAKDFIAAVSPYRKQAITLRINSPGGSVFDGLAIYNFVKGINCTVRIDGLAASIASTIAMAGKTVCMAENSFLMIHNPSNIVWGNAEDMRQMADALDKFRDSLANIYATKTGQDSKQIRTWMDDETWFSSAEAKAAGFADEITEEIAMAAKFDLRQFPKAPAALIDPPVDSPKKANDMAETFLDKLKAKCGITPKPSDPEDQALEEIKAIQSERDQLKADLSTAKQSISTQAKSIESKDAEITKLQADHKTAIDALEASVEQRASAKALTITQGQGQPPLAAIPKENPADQKTPKPQPKPMTPSERIQALHAERNLLGLRS